MSGRGTRDKGDRERWERLADLVHSLNRIMEANARIDAHEPWGDRKPRARHNVIVRLLAIERRVDREIDLLTALLLRLQLHRKMRKCAKERARFAALHEKAS